MLKQQGGTFGEEISDIEVQEKTEIRGQGI
jgi:hypothetical protein